MSEEFDIIDDQIYFNGDLIGYLTVPEGTLRERAVNALMTHLSIEDQEDGMEDVPEDFPDG